MGLEKDCQNKFTVILDALKCFFLKASNIVAENIIQHFPLIIRIPQKGGCRRGLLYAQPKL